MSTENTRMSNNGHSNPIVEESNSSSDVKPVSIFSTDYKK